MDFHDRPAADDFLSARNDVMTVYRDFENTEGRLFPLRYVRSGFRSVLPTVMVVPGGPGVASVFPYELLRRDMVSKGLDVIMMEHRGVGMSRADAQGRDLPEDSMRVEFVLDDMCAVLEHAGVRNVVLYGTGYGAYLAQRFTLAYPERVHSLVLDSPSSSVADERAFKETLRDMYFHGKNERTESIAKAVRRLIANGIVPEEETGPVLAAVHEYGGVRAVHELVDLLVVGRGQLAWASIHQILSSREWLTATPYVFENDLVGRIAATELGYGSEADFEPLDPLTLAATRAELFPPFAGEEFDLDARMSEIRVPTLVLSGDRDLVTPRSRAMHAAFTIPGAARESGSGYRIVTVRNTGHSILDQTSALAVQAARWAAAGAIDQFVDRDHSSLRGGVVPEAFGRGIRTALLAEKYAPIKLWSARSLREGHYGSADARGTHQVLVGRR